MQKLFSIIIMFIGFYGFGQPCPDSETLALELVPTLEEGEYTVSVTSSTGVVYLTGFSIEYSDESELVTYPTVTTPSQAPFTLLETLTFSACNTYEVTVSFTLQCTEGTFISLTQTVHTGGGGGEITSTALGCGSYNFTSSEAELSPTSVWSFGDGEYTTDDETTTHTYTSNGDYVITVNDPTDDLFCSEYEVITVTGLPESEITATTNCLDNIALFTASGDPSWTYSWDYGDGTTATGQSVSRTYVESETYIVSLTVTDGVSCSSIQTKTITVGPIAIDFNVSDLCLGETFMPDWVPGGADEYSWDLGDETTSTDQYPIHTYTLPEETSSELFILTLTTIKDECTSVHSESITVSRKPELSITSIGVTCDPMAYNFIPTANYYTDLSWEIEGVTIPAVADEATYYLFGTTGLKNIYLNASNGTCETSELDQISIYDGLSVSISGDNTFCSTGSTHLSAIVSGGGGDYVYNWLKEGISVGTEPTLSVIEEGTYVVTVTEVGCESFSSASIEITELTLPTVDEITTTAVDCPGDANGSYTITFDPVPEAGYIINGGLLETDPTYTETAMSEGVHYITISHPLNPSCFDIEEIIIGYEGPVLTLEATPVSCVTGGTFEALLSGTVATITSIDWFVTGDLIPSYTSASSTYPDVAPGFYIATATLSDGCVVSSASTQMTLPHLTATFSETYVCEDAGSTTVTVTPVIDPGVGTFTYLWSNAATTASTTVSAGDYDVIITDTPSGCSITKSVSISAVAPLELTASTSPVGCADGEGEILVKGTAEVHVSGGSGSFDYDWSALGGGFDYSSPLLEDIIASETYTVTVIDIEYGCTKDITFTVNNSTPLTSVSVVTSDCGAEATVVGGTAPYTYQWIDATSDLLVATSGTGTAPTLAPGTYEVTVVDAFNCRITSSTFVVSAATGATVDLSFKFTFAPKELPTEEPPIDEELSEEMQIAADQILNQLSDCIIHQSKTVAVNFSSACLNRESFKDKLSLAYQIDQQQYTLYYYDRAGNLTKTVPPEGVEFLSEVQAEEIIAYREEGALPSVWIPDHRLETTYEYNSLHELISQNTPDGGEANYIYDSNKRLRFSQSARQEDAGLFSYTKYDALGRPIEAGESSSTEYPLDFTDQLTAGNFTAADSINFPETDNQEVMYTVYSQPSSISYYGEEQTYTQNRVSYVIKDEDGDFTTTTDQFKTHYSYDVHGNVKWMAQEDPVIGKNYVAYDYDLVSGNVKEVKYNEKRADKFFHRYKYDSDNRLVSAETSRDYVIWDTDAKYDYYLHGPLKRKEIGEDNIQGEDYTYTIQGWLKAINNTGSKTDDPGQDGTSPSNFMTDVFGMTLGYFRGDFTRGDAGGTNIFAGKNIYTSLDGGGSPDAYATADLYNGNISSWSSQTNTGNLTPDGVTEDIASRTHISVYQYDDLQRIRSSKYYRDTDVSDAVSYGIGVANQYATSYEYDRNGNLHELIRRNKTGTISDHLNYDYDEGGGNNTTKQKNQLSTVNDLVLTETGTSIVGEHEYTYDPSGNLTKDEGVEMLGYPLEEHDVVLDIEWNVAGKVQQITKTVSGLQINQIEHVIFHYDAMGNRIGKEHISDITEPELVDITRYTLDASGNTMGIYKIDVTKDVVEEVTVYTAQLKLLEHPIYGSSRIGMNNEPVVLQTWEFTEGMAPDYTYDEDGTHTVSELSNWIMAGIKTDNLNETDNVSEICHCQIKQTAFSYDEISGLYTHETSDLPLPQSYYGQIDNGLAVGETTDGDLDLYAVNVNNYLGTTNQCLIFNADNEPVKGTEGINHIESQTKPLLSQITGNENYYRLFILDENKHPKTYLVNAKAQGWGSIGEQKGEVDPSGTIINEGYDYGRHMAVIEDHINERSIVYMTRFIPKEAVEDCLGKFQLVAYEYTSELDAEPIETVLTEMPSNDINGEGELQLSADGTHLVYYNRTDNISGFAHKTLQINVFELGGDKTTVIGTKIVSRTFNEGEGDPDYMHYGTYGGASVEFANGNNLMFSQRGIFEENEADPELQDGSEKQVYYYNFVDGTVNVTTSGGTSQFNEIRRGKNDLYYVLNEQEMVDLNEITTTGEVPFPYTAIEVLPVMGEFKLISSLPSQPYKLIGDEAPVLYDRLVGAKQYEFNDHLGNVRAVVSDRRGYVAITEPETDVYEIENAPELVAWTDYMPFGMRMDGRSESTSEYRYGFQGQEHDDEVKGAGNSVNYKYRMHDPRIGRFFAVDPLAAKYPYYSPFQFDGNMPTRYVELEGLEPGLDGTEVGQTEYAQMGTNNNIYNWTWSETSTGGYHWLAGEQYTGPTAQEAASLEINIYDQNSSPINTISYLSQTEQQKGTNNVAGYTLIRIDTDENGFRAGLYEKTLDGVTFSVLVFTGTNEGVDWVTNGVQGAGLKTGQYDYAVEFAQFYMDRSNVTLVGHSLGGGLASLAGWVTGLPTITFNAAGLSAGTIDQYNLENKPQDNITAYVIMGEILNSLLEPMGQGAEGNVYKLRPGSLPPYFEGNGLDAIKATLTRQTELHSMEEVLKALNYNLK